MNHPFKDTVDRIYVLTCIKYRKTRASILMGHLRNLGLADMTDLMIQTGSPMDMLVWNHIDPINSGASQTHVIDIFLNHYHAIKTGYDLGYSRILILEDDASIIKDQEYLRSALSMLPADVICAILDCPGSEQDYKKGMSSSHIPLWGVHDGVSFNGTQGYILNRTGMERWISYCESMISTDKSKPKFDAADHIWTHLLKKGEQLLFPEKPLVIQTAAGSSGGITECLEKYKRRKIEFSDYSPNKEDNFTVVYASNGNDYARLEMSAFSIRKFLGESVNIVLLTASTKDPNVPGIVKVDPNSILSKAGFFERGWNRKWPYATLYRMAIPLLPYFRRLDRVLYIDTDVLCRSEESRTLFSMNLGNYEAFAAFDHATKIDRIPKIVESELCPEAKIALKEKIWDPFGTRAMTYVNAGVVLYNLRQIRSLGESWYEQRLKWFWEAECRGRFAMLDQDFLNIMMATHAGLNKRYNWFGGTADTDCVFQHFVTTTKENMESVAKSIGWMS